jgi:hypothetical protein
MCLYVLASFQSGVAAFRLTFFAYCIVGHVLTCVIMRCLPGCMKYNCLPYSHVVLWQYYLLLRY